MQKWEFGKVATVAIVLVAMVAALTSCGTEGGTTIISKSFNVGRALFAFPRLATSASVTDFKLCVARIRLENESGEAQGGDDSGEIDFTPGLIDLSDGNQKTWGSLELPVGFALKRIKIKIHKREALCGENYSVRFNGVQTDEEVEMEWGASSASTFQSGTSLYLELGSLVQALLERVDASTLTSETLKQTLEEIEEQLEVNEEHGNDD